MSNNSKWKYSYQCSHTVSRQVDSKVKGNRSSESMLDSHIAKHQCTRYLNSFFYDDPHPSVYTHCTEIIVDNMQYGKGKYQDP